MWTHVGWCPGFIGNIMASRISSLWDFNDPAFTISAAEQSVARCIDVAQNLMSQESMDAVVIAADRPKAAVRFLLNSPKQHY
ncbi:beta-ketoacyl synthase N-terminal-like domain-containing protein [Vibrio lentus]|nr:beta-ketoacyl synthase N-terminal-like domain-containing protein [Vibrio lentus]